MRHRFTRSAAATCTIVLLASACTDITQPPSGRRALDPSFSHDGPSETRCTTGLITGTHDNVAVPPGQSCFIIGATVFGNVKALEGSQLTINLSAVHGNVEGDRPGWVQIINESTVGNVFITGAGVSPPDPQGAFTILIGSTVTVTGGDVHILKSTANTISIEGVSVGKGSIKVEDNSVLHHLTIQDNKVAQNLQVFKNKGDGPKEVSDNTVGANLQCFENDPPFEGRGNAARKAEGQCSTDPLPDEP